MTTPGPHVFGDGRLGLWIVNPENLAARLPKILALPYPFTDLFLPRTATKAHADLVRGTTLFPQLWEAIDGRTAAQMADDVMADVLRLKVGAVDLNVETGTDAALEPYCRSLVGRIRATMPSRRLRLNVAWRKGGFLPIDLLRDDPNLYACEQGYFAAEDLADAAAALENLVDAGVPLTKAAVCYLAGGHPFKVTPRVSTLPAWAPSRGVVFQDDLLAEVGVL